MWIEAIIQIGILAAVFFVCSLVCYCLCTYLLKEEGKNYVKPETVAWDQKFYYDPLPTSRISPSDGLGQPTVYSFKVHNGGTFPYAQPHAVINPAALQYPPGHILEDRQILPIPLPSDTQVRSSSKILPGIDLKSFGFKGKSPINNGGLGPDSDGWIA